MSTKPTFEQAQLHLQVYDQRREARLRQARDWFFKNYFADNWGDAMRMAAPGTEGGTNFMMVVSYWSKPALRTMDSYTMTCSSRPAGNFSASGSGSSRRSLKDGNNGPTSSSSAIWNRLRSAMKSG